MKADRILVFEPLRRGEEHQPFNASLLIACLAAFPVARTTFVAEQEHLAAVSAALPSLSRLELISLRVMPRRQAGFARWHTTYAVARELMQHVQHIRPDVVIFPSVTPELLWWLKRLSTGLGKTPTAAILHGGLAGVLRRPRYNVIARLSSLRNALLKAPGFMRFIVLEEGIQQYLIGSDPTLASRTTVLPHPLPPDLLNGPHFQRVNARGPIRVGLLGLCTPQKGLFRFLELAKHAKESGTTRLRFEIVGRLHQAVSDRVVPYLQFLDRLPARQKLPREEFVSAAANLHFAAFLFDGNHYEVTASGVLLDCIAMGIPVIAERRGIFAHIGSRERPIGIVRCERLNSEALVQALSSVSACQYDDYCHNISALAPARHPENLAGAMRQALSP